MTEQGPAPRWWKQLLVTFLVAFPTVEILTRLLAPRLGFLPPLPRDMVVVASMCVVLSSALPLASRPLRRWLSS